MIPLQDTLDAIFIQDGIETKIQPGKTYKMQIEQETIKGKTDGKDALAQAIYKEINTEPGLPIYTQNYGVKKKDLFGQQKEFAFMIISDRIKTALEKDDRIKKVYEFYFHEKESIKDHLVMSFKVDSIFGEIEIKEAGFNGI